MNCLDTWIERRLAPWVHKHPVLWFGVLPGFIVLLWCVAIYLRRA